MANILERSGTRFRAQMSASRWILVALGTLAGLAGVGALYQLVSEARDRSKRPLPGKLVDVGGHRLHIHCTGEGSPTVVMDAGGAGSSLDWSLVQPEDSIEGRSFRSLMRHATGLQPMSLHPECTCPLIPRHR